MLLAAALYAVWWACTAMAFFTGTIAGGWVGLHSIVRMGLGIAAGIIQMMVLRRLQRW
jgi:hypothetical protein